MNTSQFAAQQTLWACLKAKVILRPETQDHLNDARSSKGPHVRTALQSFLESFVCANGQFGECRLSRHLAVAPNPCDSLSDSHPFGTEMEGA